jgi:hypothetical protein
MLDVIPACIESMLRARAAELMVSKRVHGAFCGMIMIADDICNAQDGAAALKERGSAPQSSILPWQGDISQCQ